MVNYLISTRKKNFFLEAVATGAQSHSAAWIASDISRVIHKNEHFDVAGVVTDNTSANKGAWKLLQAEFPQKFFYGLYF